MNYIVKSIEQLPDLSPHRELLLDTETSGLSAHHGHRICGIVIGPAGSDDGWYIPVRHVAGEPNVDPVAVFDWLRKLASDPGRAWVFHNAKFDLGMLRAEGVEIAGPLIDTMIVAHVIESNLFNYSLDSLTRIFLKNFEHKAYAKLKAWLEANQKRPTTEIGKISHDYSLAPVELLGEYALEDLQATRLLLLALWKRPLQGAPDNRGLSSQSQLELMRHEMRLVRVIFEMEWTGLKIDLDRAVRMRDEAQEEMENYLFKMHALAGHPFNPSSYKEMHTAFEAAGGRVLFWSRPDIKNMAKYPGLKRWEFKGKQKLDQFTTDYNKSTGRPCWNSMAVLSYLKLYQKSENWSPYWFLIYFYQWDLRRRIVATYIDNFVQGVDYRERLHGSFNQHGTQTGRLSADKPNLQNLAKPEGTADQKTFEKFFGATDEDAINRKVRELVVAEHGNVLVSCDWSQLEYRIAAYLANDDVIKKKYIEDVEADYHQMTADLMGVDRSLAKTLNFGMLYGMLANGLAKSLTSMGVKTTTFQAEQLLHRVYSARPAMKQLIDEMSALGEKQGWVQNPAGRVVRVPPKKGYVSLNYVDQGLGGDMMRACLVLLHVLIQTKTWPVWMVATVHDEVLFEMPEALVAEAVPALRELMCQCPWIDIPLFVDCAVGKNWGQMVAFDDWVASRKSGENNLAPQTRIG